MVAECPKVCSYRLISKQNGVVFPLIKQHESVYCFCFGFLVFNQTLSHILDASDGFFPSLDALAK